jgi:ABC-type branched-subunit amino acid transport system ATPase component
LITKLTVKENIVLAMPQNPTDNWLNAMLPENFYRKLNAAWEKKAEEIIEGFFLSEVKSSQAGNISYGQQKLLSLACCMANGASLLLLDEPVAGVQPEYRNKIAKLLKQLREDGKTILLIEHNTDFIAEVADKIFFLHEGKISIFNDMETLRKDKQAMEAYI